VAWASSRFGGDPDILASGAVGDLARDRKTLARITLLLARRGDFFHHGSPLNVIRVAWERGPRAIRCCLDAECYGPKADTDEAVTDISYRWVVFKIASFVRLAAPQISTGGDVGSRRRLRHGNVVRRREIGEKQKPLLPAGRNDDGPQMFDYIGQSRQDLADLVSLPRPFMKLSSMLSSGNRQIGYC